MSAKTHHGEDQNAWTLLLDAVARLNAVERAAAIRELQRALGASDPHTAGLLLDLLGKGPAASALGANGPAPPAAIALLARVLRRAIERHSSLELSPAGLEALPGALARRPLASLRPLVGPALRVVIGRPTDADVHLLVQFLKEIAMTPTFFVDPSSIPLFQDPNTRDTLIKSLTDKVASELQFTFGVSPAQADVKTVPSAAAVLGMVMLDGEADANSGSLRTALQRAWLESIGEMPAIGPTDKVPLSEVYKFIAETLPKFKGGNTNIADQEFAFVARNVIANGASIKFGHPDFESAIRIALDQYVQTRATGDSLSLPPGTLPGGTQNAGGDADLNTDNIRVIGLVYPLALLEKALPLRVADRIAELFMNGLLPFGQGAAGKAIDEYYWDAEDRLNEAQRRSQYARMIGMPGGEVSKEVAPNKNFEQLFLRFISAVSEFTRQREVDRMFTNRTSILATTDEQVRKCAFEVAQNASLYAWGGSFHVAARINRHLQKAIDILNQPPVLRTYAASNHWQVIERVAQQDFGGAPNWAKYSTMAQAASRIFDVLARNTPALTASASGQPFLFDPALAGNSGFTISTTTSRAASSGTSGLSPADTNQILTSVQLWLAVNGVRDDQVRQYAQPVEMNTVPSIPTLPAQPATAAGSDLDVLNKLRQLTASGTPNPDQLQQLLATLH